MILIGCSNGGFMSLLMAMTYPGEYDGIVPICEALKDERITDAQLEAVKDLPMYFVYSEDDDTVVPELYEIHALNRLGAIGASNVHVSTTEPKKQHLKRGIRNRPPKVRRFHAKDIQIVF